MTNILSGHRASRLACAMAAVLGLQVLGACAPLLLGGVVMSGMVAVDRRTSGIQLEDQAIELKSLSRIKDVVGDRSHVSTTSYNRMVLITGEAATEADRSAIEQAIRQIENVRSVVNEVAVMAHSSLGSRSSDLVITSKVKARFIDASDLQSLAFKVVTERGVVHLMGRVTEREAGRSTELVRSISGVQKVVRVFEVISEAELAQLQPPAQK